MIDVIIEPVFLGQVRLVAIFDPAGMTNERTGQTSTISRFGFVRAAAMLLGLLLHVCIFFMPPEKYFWGSGDYSGDILNAQFLNFIHLFRMQLFFLLAGFFAELVVDRKGLSTFVLDRLKRILLPFVVGVLVMVPVFTLLNGNFGYYNNLYDGKNILEIIRSSARCSDGLNWNPVRASRMDYYITGLSIIF